MSNNIEIKYIIMSMKSQVKYLYALSKGPDNQLYAPLFGVLYMIDKKGDM